MQNYIRRWRATWNPNMYHGWGQNSGYFEGWYFKLADAHSQHVFAVIPGISKGSDGNQHAFIQVFDGKSCKARYHQFERSEFKPSSRKFELTMGGNFFSEKRIHLELPELKGELFFKNPIPWPKMFGAPGIMGWYSFVPFMECYHGVVSLFHELEGKLDVSGVECDFGGGIGYTEKDWGVSFPRSWIWMQSNHFDAGKEICLMASIAHIPWLGSYFIGYIVGFLFEGKLHRFATYTGAKMKAGLSDNSVLVAFKDRKHQLEITGIQAPGAKLVSPITGNMVGKINESIQAKLHVRFFENDKLLFDGTGINAGMEIAGEVDELLTEQWRR